MADRIRLGHDGLAGGDAGHACAMLDAAWADRPGAASRCASLHGRSLARAGFFNVYPMRYSFVADHFAYLALLGPIVLAAAAVYTLRIRSPRALSVAAFCGIVLVLGVSTFHRTRIYESRTSLWRDTVARNPTAWIAHNNLGALTADAGDLDSAERHFRTVLELKPDHSEARNNLGVGLLRHGRAHEQVDRQCPQRPGHTDNPDPSQARRLRAGNQPEETQHVGHHPAIPCCRDENG